MFKRKFYGVLIIEIAPSRNVLWFEM